MSEKIIFNFFDDSIEDNIQKLVDYFRLEKDKVIEYISSFDNPADITVENFIVEFGINLTNFDCANVDIVCRHMTVLTEEGLEDVKEITEDSNMALKISSDELYKMREKSILQNRTDQMLTEKEMDYWEEKDKQIETPFTYEYTESWSNLWNYMYTINFMILLMLAICLSNVFSVEYLRKTDAIILCSQYGKKHLYLAKVLAGISFGVIIAILFFGITAISSICVYGADGFSAALQIAFPLSSWNISVGESVLVLLFVLLIISVLYSVAIVILSEILKNSVAVMAIPVGIMILTMMIDIPYQFRIASQIYDLLPTNLLTVWELWDDRLVSVFGKYLTNFQIAPILYLIIIIVLFFVGKRVYLKHQIGAR